MHSITVRAGGRGAPTAIASVAVVAVLSCPCKSFCVAETLRLKFAAFRGVMVRDDSDHPSTLTDVLPVVAVKVLTPSLSVAPTGMALIVSVARLLLSPAKFLALAPRFNAIGDPATPVTATGANVGASGLTIIASVAVVAVLSCPCESFCVAETLRLKFAAFRGVMVRDDSDHPSTLTDVLPVVAVKVLTPSLSVAPTGMALIVSVAKLLLSPAKFLALAPRFKAIGDPSTPLAATGANVGATGLMVTVSLAVAVALRLPCASFSVAAMDSVNSAAFAGVILRLVRVQAAMFVDVLPAVAVKEWPLPSLSTAPTGMALTTMEAQLLASPETLLSAAPRFNVTGDPSTPVTATGANVGASGLTVIASVAVVAVLSCPCESFCVAETLRLKFAAFRGVMVRDDSDHPSTLTDVLPVVAVKVLTPSLSVAPTGMALIVSVARLLLSPARFLALAPRFKAIGDPSTPLAATGANVGATGLMVTVSLAVAVALRLPCASFSVAAMDSVNSAAFAGVILRLVRVQAAMFVDVLPAVAVKEWPLPSLSTAPTGMALTTMEAQLLASPETLLSAAPRFNVTGDPSTPVAATGAMSAPAD